MIDIVASVCLLAVPDACGEVRLPLDGEYKAMTPHQCMHMGQVALVKWFEENPGFRLEKFKCVDGSKRKEDA